MTESLRMQLGRYLLARRRRAGVSRAVFAARLGIHPTMLGRLERATANAQLGTLERLARGLGMPLSELLREASGGE